MAEIRYCPLSSGDHEHSFCCGEACQWWDGADCAIKNISLMLRIIGNKVGK